jgi:hypothetical protein
LRPGPVVVEKTIRPAQAVVGVGEAFRIVVQR